MTQAPNWTPAEFEKLLENPGATDAEAAALVGGRSEGAVAAVREGIHSRHVDEHFRSLSEMMQRRLGDKSRPVKCPRCGAPA